MYEFHYDYIKSKYDNNWRLLFISKDKECLIYYSAEAKYYDDSNKEVVGKMKDETCGVAIEEFVGLKPKMYSFLILDRW